MNCGDLNTFLRRVGNTDQPSRRKEFSPTTFRRGLIALVLGAFLVVTQIGVLTEDALAVTCFGTLTCEDQYILPTGFLAQDQFGKSSAISGDTLVVGTPGDDTIAGNDGSAHVFRYNGSIWVEEQKLIAADSATNDQFGVAVDIEGDTIVVGAFADGAGTNDYGAAYIFERSGSTWTQMRKLQVAGLPTNARLGWSVATNGTHVAVTSIGTGTVYVWQRDAAGAAGWSNLQVATLPGSVGNLFGESISMDGDTLVVSARVGVGAAVVYDAATNFGLVRVLYGPVAEVWGYRVAVSGDTLAVAALGTDTGTILNHGGIYLYERNQGGANVWGFTNLLVPGEVATGFPTDRQLGGRAVAINGDVVVAGAISDDSLGTDSGSAYVFQRNEGGAGAWGQTNKLVASNGAPYKYFGFSAAVGDGVVFVGSPGYPPANSSLVGEGYMYNIGSVSASGGGPSSPPVAPTPGTPAGETTVRTHTFSWPAVSGATQYHIWLYGPDSSTLFQQWYTAAQLGCDSGGTCSVAVGGTLPMGTLNWHLRALNEHGTGPWSGAGVFTVIPDAANVTGPTGTVSAASPTFTWDSVGGATQYYLWVNNSAGQNIFSQWYSSNEAGCAAGGTCSITPASPVGFGNFAFWIRSGDTGGNGTWSAPNFYSASPLISPTGAQGGNSPNYVWSAVPGATQYHIWLYGPGGVTMYQGWFTAAQMGCSGGGTCTLPLGGALGPGSYSWYMRSWDGSATSGWSGPLTFVIS